MKKKVICIKPLLYHYGGKSIQLKKGVEYELEGLDHKGRGDLSEYLREPGLAEKVAGAVGIAPDKKGKN